MSSIQDPGVAQCRPCFFVDVRNPLRSEGAKELTTDYVQSTFQF